jgi:hypothetical protein
VKLRVLLPHLDERQRRLALGAEARMLGHGGIRLVARAAGVRVGTVARGVAELDSGEEPLGRARRPGGGRKRAADTDPGLVPALLALVEPDMRGDPMSPLRWTAKSTRKLAAELTRQGHPVSAGTVGDVLRQEGFSLQGNSRTIEGAQHPDRDAQFRYINEQAAGHLAAGEPVISVDAKKKEKVGNYAGQGAEWEPESAPVRVRDHDFPGQAGTVTPYGVYDLAANAGWVNVGTDHDTAAFAVESVRRWWDAAGRAAYPAASRLLVTADAGGSNGYRTRAWKAALAALAAQTGLDITVCHFPPGTSKWNQIEHRLFSHISMNWRGRPLTSHEVIVNTIAATTTATGLTVRAELDTGLYPPPLPRHLELHPAPRPRRHRQRRPRPHRSPPPPTTMRPGHPGQPRSDRDDPPGPGRPHRGTGHPVPRPPRAAPLHPPPRPPPPRRLGRPAPPRPPRPHRPHPRRPHPPPPRPAPLPNGRMSRSLLAAARAHQAPSQDRGACSSGIMPCPLQRGNARWRPADPGPAMAAGVTPFRYQARWRPCLRSAGSGRHGGGWCRGSVVPDRGVTPRVRSGPRRQPLPGREQHAARPERKLLLVPVWVVVA